MTQRTAPRKPSASIGIALRLLVVLAAGALATLVITHWDTWVGARVRQTTDDAYVRGDITPMSAKVDGYLRTVAVKDFPAVKAGDLLVEIDDAEFRAEIARGRDRE